MTNQNAYVEAIAAIYQINILPYFETRMIRKMFLALVAVSIIGFIVG